MRKGSAGEYHWEKINGRWQFIDGRWYYLLSESCLRRNQRNYVRKEENYGRLACKKDGSWDEEAER